VEGTSLTLKSEKDEVIELSVEEASIRRILGYQKWVLFKE